MTPAPIAAHSPWRQLLLVSSVLDTGAVTLNQLCPLESFAPADGAIVTPVVDDVLGSVLCGLNDLESVMKDIIAPTCQIYVLGIDTTAELAALCSRRAHSVDDIRLAIALLHAIGLVYRLPSALKFGYDPAKFHQIRVSGWGRHHLTEGAKPSRSARPWIQRVLENHLTEYRELIALCNSPDRPLKVALIHRLNSSLPIPLVT